MSKNSIDSFFDFSFADSTGNIQKFVSGQKAASDYGAFVVRGEQRFAEQNPAFVNAPFYSNHDMDRSAGYYSGAVAEQQIKMAAALNMTMSGNAFLYYGDEIGMQGMKDPFNRGCMDWSHQNKELLKWYKRLGEIRNGCPALKEGEFEIVSCSGENPLKKRIYKNLSFDGELFENAEDFALSKPHVQTVLEGEYPWVVTLAVKTEREVFGGGKYIAIDFSFSEIASYILTILRR